MNTMGRKFYMKFSDALEELNVYLYLTKGCELEDELLIKKAKSLRPNVCNIIKQFNSVTKGCMSSKLRLLKELRLIGDRYGMDMNFSSISQAERELMKIV